MKRAENRRAAQTSYEYSSLRRAARWRKCALLVATMLTLGAAHDSAAAYGDGSESGAGARGRWPAESSAFGLPVPRPPTKARPAILLAHAIVVRTSPAQNGVAADTIGKVEVWYDAGIRDAFAALAVVSASGARVDKRDAAIDKTDASHVSVSVDPLPPGKYTARYRALSADGHLVSGAWEFEVRP
jgi:methionine-rich copper-binding protein CopC